MCLNDVSKYRVRVHISVCFFCFVSLYGFMPEALSKDKTNTVQRSDRLIEQIVTGDDRVAYRFTESAVKCREKRLIYSYVLNVLIHGDEGSDFDVVQELLPREDDRQDFLDKVYRISDSTVWGDGNQDAAYFVLMDFKHFGEYGCSLANRLIAAKIKDCDLSNLDFFTFLAFVCSGRQEASSTFNSIAQCALKSNAGNYFVLGSAVGLARVDHREQAVELIKRLETFRSTDEPTLSKCKEIRKLIANLPSKSEDLCSDLEKVLD